LGGLIINKLLIWSRVKSSITGFDGVDSPFITNVDSNAWVRKTCPASLSTDILPTVPSALGSRITRDFPPHQQSY